MSPTGFECWRLAVRAQDVMTRPVHTISPAAGADDAWNQMRLKGIHHLVVTEGRRIAGILSDRDIGGRHGASLRKTSTVGDLMTKGVVTVTPETPLRKAANLMRGRSLGCVVVATGDRAVGIITTADVLELVGRGVNRPVAEATRWTLRHRAPHRPRTRAAGAW
jgi:CBS domain-containing protein